MLFSFATRAGSPQQCIPITVHTYYFLFSLPTKAWSPQQSEPITVGPYYLSHPVNFPCGRKPEYPEKTQDFQQSIDYTLFMRGLGSYPPGD